MNQQTTRRSGALLVLVAVAVLGITFAANADEPLDEVRVALKWLPQSQFAGYYVAAALGFYQQQNLDVTLIPGGTGVEPQDLVASGSADFGVTWMGILLEARDQGIPLVNIAQIFQSSGFRYLTWRDSGLSSPADLRGQTIETWYGGNEVPLLALLEKYGIDPTADVTLQSQAFDMNAFLNRSVSASAAMSYNELNSVFEAIVADALGLDPSDVLSMSVDDYRAAEAAAMPSEQLTLFDVNTENVALLEDMIFTSESFLSTEINRDIAVRFVRASLQGWAYASEHQSEAVDIVLAQDEAGTMSRLHQTLMLEDVLSLIEDSGTPLGYLEPASFQQTADIALQFGVIYAAASSDAYSNDIWEQAIAD